MRLTITCLLFFLDFFPSLAVIVPFTREVDQFAKLLMKTESKFKKDAQKQLSRKQQEFIGSSNVSEVKHTRDYKILIFLLLFLIIDVLMAV